MARRSLYGLLFLALASCAAPVKPGDITSLGIDAGARDLAGGNGGNDDGFVADAATGGASDLSLGSTCVDGGACTTSNPGACAGGHIACSGNVATCVPDVTTQSCYTGGAGTMGVGACKAGTQTCIGTLGSCDGQVLPATIENCYNDVDDDCDSKVNNGCPDHLTTGTPVGLTQQGNAAGGGAFSLRCPANSYITGITFYGDNTDSDIAGLDISCATPTLVRGASAYSVTPTAVTPNPSTVRASNVTTSVSQSYSCGTTAFTPGYYVQGAVEFDSASIEELGLSCSTAATPVLSPTNQLSFTFSKAASQGINGYGYSDNISFEDDCPATSVLIGFDGRDGNWFDALTPVCAPIQVVYK